MLAVSHGIRVSEGQPIPLEYWQAECDSEEEAQAKYNLHVARVEWEVANAAKPEGIA